MKTPLGRATLLAAGAIALITIATLAIPNIWYRLAAAYALLIPAAVAGVRLDWRALLRPTIARIAVGLAAAGVLYVAVWVVLRIVPAFVPHAQAAARWKDLVPPYVSLPALLLVILGEEIVWRGAVTWPWTARFGPWVGPAAAALGFGAAHVAMGAPILVLAAGALGFCWGVLAVRTKSLVPAIVSHVAWDVAVLFVLPL